MADSEYTMGIVICDWNIQTNNAVPNNTVLFTAYVLDTK